MQDMHQLHLYSQVQVQARKWFHIVLALDKSHIVLALDKFHIVLALEKLHTAVDLGNLNTAHYFHADYKELYYSQVEMSQELQYSAARHSVVLLNDLNEPPIDPLARGLAQL
ncbi:hypothetical protein X975_07613, partial [Stegodyphus mimosarum]